MGNRKQSRDAYTSARKRYAPKGETSTKRGEQQARATGRLNPLVDPRGLRESRMRFAQRTDNKLWQVTVGCPITYEARVDTTSSMGDHADRALDVLQDTYEMASHFLPGCDLQMSTGIFNDRADQFVLCRPQFEMESEKIVEQFTYLVPERLGGDPPEDPQYGLLAAAGLTDSYANKIGIYGYDFTVSDQAGRDRLEPAIMDKVFGSEVYDLLAKNGHQISRADLPSTTEVVQVLLKRAHAFFLQVGTTSAATRFWTRVMGHERVVILPRTELIPHVQAVIIGLTEGTLDILQIEEFLSERQVIAEEATQIAEAVTHIPIKAQADLPNFNRRPKKDDLFRNKTDLWPIDAEEVPERSADTPPTATKPPIDWL